MTEQTRSVVLDFPVELTPHTQRPTRACRYRAIDNWGLMPGHAQLIKEAMRLERLADKNAAHGNRINGAMAKRARASMLRRAAEMIAEVARQIHQCDR